MSIDNKKKIHGVRANIQLTPVSSSRVDKIREEYRSRNFRLRVEDIINAVITHISEEELQQCISNLKERRDSAQDILKALDTGALKQSDIAALMAKAKAVDALPAID